MSDWFSLRDTRLDLTMIAALAAASVVGVLTIYSAVKGQGLTEFCWKQVVWLGIGWLLMLCLAHVNYRTILDFSWIAYGFLALVLVYLLLAGRTVSGAKSWFSVGLFSIQPSELMKITVVMLLGRAFSRFHRETISFGFLLELCGIIGIPMMLVALQPDFGTAIIFAALFGVSLILAGLRRIHVVLLVLAVTAGSFGMWQYGFKQYQKERILNFVNPAADPKGGGYQVNQSKIAIGSGGWFGKGFGKGSQSQLDFVPEKHTDFIVSVFAEEMGFMGTAALLGLLLFITLRCLHLGSFSNDRQGLVLAAGVATLFATHCMINIGTVVGLLPAAGIPLPMMSYGGSSTVAMLVGFGLVLSVGRTRFAS